MGLIVLVCHVPKHIVWYVVQDMQVVRHVSQDMVYRVVVVIYVVIIIQIV